MKLFTLYYDRYTTASTSKMINMPHTVLCHNNYEKFNCIGVNGTLIQTNQPKGIQNNFNYALSSLEKDEWGIFMSDDLVGAKVLQNNKFIDCNIEYPLKELINIIPKCDKAGIKLVGLNSTGNPFYAKNKYSKFGLVDGRCFAIKKTSFRFHKDIFTIPDYYATLYHMCKYGGNLILNYCYLDFKRYEPGGLGSVNDRLEQKYNDIRILKSLYPKNIKIKNKPNEPKDSHIIIVR